MNNRPQRTERQQVRAVATAMAERDGQLLLVQLARGPFAGFWLLPSATAETGTVAEIARRLVPERTGCPVTAQRLVSVVEEPRFRVLVLRFVFATEVDEQSSEISDPDIARARWFTRDMVDEVLAERDVVPTLGVMSLLRSWVDGIQLNPLEVVVEESLCPCGSGFSYKGCCGWDAR